MKYPASPILLIIAVLLSACTPHPSSGVWQASEKNDFDINKLVLDYDGRAYFTTNKQNTVEWHCFWAAVSDNASELRCKPSNDPDLETHYTLTVDEQGKAQMTQKTQLIASFVKQDADPQQEK